MLYCLYRREMSNLRTILILLLFSFFFSFRIFQGAILTTMLATRNFSSKYDVPGEYLWKRQILCRNYSITCITYG